MWWINKFNIQKNKYSGGEVQEERISTHLTFLSALCLAGALRFSLKPTFQMEWSGKLLSYMGRYDEN